MKCKYLEHQVCIRTNGEYRLCCASLEPDHGYNIRTHTIKQWLSSDIHTNAVKLLENDIFPDSCLRCKTDEQAGIQSMRQRPNVYGPGLSHLDIRFNNQCNLRCVMCGPHSSSSLMLEHKQLGKNSPWGNIVAEEFNWFDEDLVDELASIPTLKEVYMTGGEPFMVKGLDKFIDKLDRNVQLRFNTNGTLTNNKLLNLLCEFDNVNLAYSVDGIGKVNDYIRYGSDWERIENNIHVAATYGLNVSITPTIQIYNYPYIQQLWDYCDRYKIPHYDTILISPSHFDIKNMAVSMREKYMLPIHTEYLKNVQINQSEVNKFISVTKTLDKHRNIDIHDYLPLVAEHYDFS